MHQPIAAGSWLISERMNSSIRRQKSSIAAFSSQHYVSKGAPDTWEKVLDGTLTGFSIGGEINEASNEFVKDAG